MTDKTTDDVFSKPKQPESSWQIFCWIIFEPELLESYAKTLSKKQAVIQFLKHYPLIALIVTLLSSAIYLFVVSVQASNARRQSRRQASPAWCRKRQQAVQAADSKGCLASLANL